MAASLAVARADTITTTTIDFENVPALAPGPALFTSAGAVQTLDVPDVATITGGVVLGLAPTLAGNPYASGSNIYATASDSVISQGGFGLPNSIAIYIPSGSWATQAIVPVINGMQMPEDYVVTAWDNDSIVSQQTLANVQAVGYAVANLNAAAITSITIAAANSSAWDFATDTITLTESSGQSHVTSTPEPASALLAIAGLATMTGVAGSRWRRYTASR